MSDAETNVIRLRENGPMVISFPIKIEGTDGNEIPTPEGKPVVALCRCGGSKNKPFCDGTHNEIDFRG